MIGASIRRDFPQLTRLINKKPIIYLDSTATSLKPWPVIRKEEEYYTHYTANIYRGIYTTSEEATQAYEDVRVKVARFISAPKSEEIIFTRNTTESINLVAYALSRDQVTRGDEIIATIMEHHSNFIPWQQMAKARGLEFNVWNIDRNGRLDTRELEHLITRKTKLLAIASASNVLGTVNDIQAIVKHVKKYNPQCLVLVDAAQSVPHMPVDVTSWGADFVAFSSHKMLGPTGVGVLWGRFELLSDMLPFQYGGEMIEEVHRNATVFKAPPHKFEAGTPHIAGVIGFGAAIDYLSKLGMQHVREHEKAITSYALDVLSSVKGITIVGPKQSDDRGGVIAFTVKGIHPHDVAQILNEDNICIRVGFHCAQPLHEYLAIGPTARASFYVYTTKQDIDALGKGLERAIRVFA